VHAMRTYSVFNYCSNHNSCL